MARIRGVAPADGPRLRASVLAVLSGEAGACGAAMDAIVARRQAAVDVLDFERAAAIQRELDGLAWILEPSRVVDGGSDLDLHGWADGVLLTFELRDGRIRDWHARSCPEPDALPLVSSTPPHWRSFATENAALAAILGADLA
jgi:excinuclease ABC subunit C